MQNTHLNAGGSNPLIQLWINALETLATGENLQLLMGLQEDGLRSHSADRRTTSSLILGGALQQALGGGVLSTQPRQNPLLVNGGELPIGSPLEAGVVVTNGIHVSVL
jgi:hypothetical protein